MAAHDETYRKNKAKWTADSAEIKAVAKWSGAKPEDTPAGMGLYAYVPIKEQADKWLGGGKDSIAAKAFAATATFLVEQKQLEKALPDYSVGVNPTYVQRAMK
jgi:taurine transport system substrate-binding protein